MARPEPPFHVARTRPSAVGWTRIGLTAASGAVLVLLAGLRSGVAWPLLVLLAVLFAGFALWTWMHHATRVVVDERGVTVSLGGFWPQRTWPVADFRTVQLRELPASTVGVTVGGYGWRRGRAIGPTREQPTAVGRGPIHTPAETQAPYRLLVTRPGTQVEIIGKQGTHYLFSPVDPVSAAEAVDQAIRARR